MTPRNRLIAAVATVYTVTAPLVWAQNAPAPIIKSIDVQYAGPATVSKGRILANMRTQVGRPYSEVAVEEDIRNLYKTGNISNVRIFGEPQPDGVKVIVVIQTKASVKEVRIEGVRHVKTKALRKLLVTKPGEQLTEANLETDRQKILEYYQDHGYKDTGVQVQSQIDEKTNKAVVTITVTEAGRTVVQHIKFEGNTIFKASLLRKQLKTKTHNIISFITKAGNLENERLAEDVNIVREFYQNHGYLDVQVGEPVIERAGKSPKVDLIFIIKEGRQYHTGKVMVSGVHVFTPDQVLKALRMQPGTVYSPKGVNDDVKAIQDLYGSLGYVDMQAVPETAPAGSLVNNVTYRIDEGSQSYVQRINVSGNTRTKDKVIRRELAVAPGEIYNTVRVDASKQRLQNLNYFERVETFASESGIPGKKDLNVIVQEKRTGSLNFGAGFSSIDKLLGFVEVTQSNFDVTNWPSFVGGGERFRARVQYGTARKDAVLSLTEPYFLDYKLAVGGELFYHDASYLSTVYNQSNLGFDLFTRKAITEFTAVRLDYRLEDITIKDVNKDAPEAIQNDKGSQLKSQLGPTFTYDSRDSVFLTRRGTRAELSTYVAGGPLGADVKIYGADLEASHYLLMPWDTILTLNGEVGTVSSWAGGTEVPIFDRLYLGGANNLRGFQFRKVGPEQKGQPIGGNTLARLTVEYTYPIVDHVRGAFFYDTGFVNSNTYSFGVKDLAGDAGIGLRLDLPIGPIRLDYGYPTQSGDTNSRNGHFNFNIGYQF